MKVVYFGVDQIFLFLEVIFGENLNESKCGFKNKNKHVQLNEKTDCGCFPKCNFYEFDPF